jgi:citrate lyase subunit beta/citryl-CoA lyase
VGVERAHDLARHPAVVAIGLGEADLQADLGASSPQALLYARSRCVIAARAAGLPPPVQSVFTNVRDIAGLRASCLEGRGLGFLGRSAIHPTQVTVINEVFTPSGDEVASARELLAMLRDAEDGGAGALTLPDGRFVDRAVAETARRTLALAARLEAGTRR